eukprot:TRINITY_DN77628_c0_g1_i1.p1 TRINITY_DN77628_c0_g1~~TRINITY_DN77628_c0_g1_i1.p1  ORF type:complete len:444 (+),score=42.12 TRINITY_DN77628_c0_g1_i1:172-1503(+)
MIRLVVPATALALVVGPSLVTASITTAAQAPTLGTVSYFRHGEDWHQGSCSSRARQSPISIDNNLAEPPMDVFKYHYDLLTQAAPLVAANGTLSVNLSGIVVGGVEYQQTFFKVVRIDFRGPAEHLIKGERKPLEVQIVHQDIADNQNHLIISTMFRCEHAPGPAVAGGYSPAAAAEADFNPNLAPFLQNQPPGVEGGSSQVVASAQAPIDLTAFIQNLKIPLADQGDTAFVSYAGSLTSPPCDEKVLWIVRRVHWTASDSQVAAFAHALLALTSSQGNYRSVMPLNRRVLTTLRPEWVPSVVRAFDGKPFSSQLPLGPNPRTDGELHAQRFAEAARAKTEHATAYVKDIGRVHADAYRAFAAGLVTPIRKEPEVPPHVLATGPAPAPAPEAAQLFASPYEGLNAVVTASGMYADSGAQAVARFLRGRGIEEAGINVGMIPPP